jgi:hypothetical protein
MYGEVPEKIEDDGEQFYAIVYPPSGNTEGIYTWKVSDLSADLVEYWCAALRDLARYDHQLPPPLDAVRVRYHTDGNIGVADFFFKGVFFSTSVLMRGDDPAEERNLIEGLVAVAREQQEVGGLKQTPFTEILEAKERPMHAIFVWTYQRGENYEIIPELTNHLAGAFMRRFES